MKMIRKAKAARTLAALVLAMTVMLGNALPVTAEGNVCDDPVQVKNGSLSPDGAADPDGEGGWILDGSIETDGGSYALEVDASGNTSSVITVNGSVTHETSDATGLNARAQQDSTAKVTVQGDVTGTSSTDYWAKGIDTEAYGSKSTVDIYVTGSVTADTEGYGTGINIKVEESASLTLFVGEDVTGEGSDEDSRAIYLENKGFMGQPGGNVDIDIGGNVTGDLELETRDKGETALDIGGNVKGDIEIETRKQGKTDLTVGESVEGNVTANTTGKSSMSLDIGKGVDGDLDVRTEGAGSSAEVMIGEDGVTGRVEICVFDESTAAVTIGGDVTSDSSVMLNVEEGATADVVIDGTVESGLVLVEDTELGSGLTLTVWEVKPGDGGAIVSDLTYGHDGDAGREILTPNEEAAAQIQYIIRVNAEQTDMITAGGVQEYTAQGKTWNVAHEGDLVTMKLQNIPDGYEITGAYSDKAQSMKLEKNEEGEYFLTVPRGGAVELSIVLNKLPDPEPDPTPDPGPAPAAEDGEAEIVLLTYTLGNGAEGDGCVRVAPHVGDVIRLMEAPERDGYTFLYWQGTDVSPDSPYYTAPDPETDFRYKAGGCFNVRESYYFTAVWQKN